MADRDLPFNGMAEAFELHFGQSFKDRDWSQEAATWAASWKSSASYHAKASPQPAPHAMTPADAVYGLLAWLTCREDVVTLGSAHDAAPAAEIAKRFCEANGLNSVSDAYPDNLEFPKKALLAQPAAAEPAKPYAWSVRGLILNESAFLVYEKEDADSFSEVKNPRTGEPAYEVFPVFKHASPLPAATLGKADDDVAAKAYRLWEQITAEHDTQAKRLPAFYSAVLGQRNNVQGTAICKQLEQVHQFLLGEGSIDHCHFGQNPDGASGMWWRQHLRDAIAAQQPAASDVRDVVAWRITDIWGRESVTNDKSVADFNRKHASSGSVDDLVVQSTPAVQADEVKS